MTDNISKHTLSRDNLGEVILKTIELKKYYKVKPNFFKPPKIVKALDGVSIELREGETLSIVGESGCGKSTLAKLLTKIESPTSGKIIFAEEDVTDIKGIRSCRVYRQNIQFVFQNPYSSLNPRKTIGDTLSESLLLNTKLDKENRKKYVLEIMDKVGLRPEFYDRYPHMFSGGQRQRVAIARGIMLNPKILVADEPVSALDVSIRAQVLNLLLDLQEDLGLSYVFISHDLSVVRHISHSVAVMYLGRIVEYASVESIFDNARHPYTISLLYAVPTLHHKSAEQRKEHLIKGELPSPLNPPLGCAFHTRCPRATSICLTSPPPLKKYPDGALIACYNV